MESLLGLVRERLVRLTSPLGRKAINATGVLLHTGLGRAPLAKNALDALAMAGCFSVVQVDLETGERSLREAKIEQMLRELTGCEAATVVNNNAAATFIVLQVLARAKEVIVSRGHLIEIGGSFRMPDVMAQSGALLREVGTTNRTHLHDYDAAIGADTGALMHVHPSNYKIQGFAGTPGLDELCALGRKHGLPVIADLGSGAIVPMDKYGLSDNLTIGEALAMGAALTCSSGDKLICGPQAGIICGQKKWIEQVRKSPFARMFRVGKLTLSALEATLLHYVNGAHEQNIPLYRMLCVTEDELRQRGEKLIGALTNLHRIELALLDDFAYVGGGSLPAQAVPTKIVRLALADKSRKNQF
ncbi:MAG TPA: L-seryl-tRNA(Sec) selenium transferase, partial [Oligoflexia bacterium]|nr:L-seryl-tRNA(Sec) selenium transferase [Oligoflexia bacterium]